MTVDILVYVKRALYPEGLGLSSKSHVTTWNLRYTNFLQLESKKSRLILVSVVERVVIGRTGQVVGEVACCGNRTVHNIPSLLYSTVLVGPGMRVVTSQGAAAIISQHPFPHLRRDKH